MAKELPYFQFEPAEYLTKDISFCSLSAQGLFANICSYYWQRSCKLTKDQFLRRLNYPKEFQELINEGVIDCVNGVISIKFLDEQKTNATKTSKKNSLNGAKGGRPKKQEETQIKPKENPIESQTKGIREDKIKEEKQINLIDSIDEAVKINNNLFNSQILKDSSYIEITAMQTKSNIETVKKYLIDFDNHLIRTSEQKNTLKDYKTHFTHWFNKQDIKKVVTNTSNPYPGHG